MIVGKYDTMGHRNGSRRNKLEPGTSKAVPLSRMSHYPIIADLTAFASLILFVGSLLASEVVIRSVAVVNCFGIGADRSRIRSRG